MLEAGLGCDVGDSRAKHAEQQTQAEIEDCEENTRCNKNLNDKIQIKLTITIGKGIENYVGDAQARNLPILQCALQTGRSVAQQVPVNLK